MAMTAVPADQAMRSPHYGLKGWLLVIYVVMALGALSGVSNAISDAQAVSMGLDSGLWRLVAVLQVGLILPFLVLTPMKHRLMPTVSVACLWVSMAITILLYATNWSLIAAAADQQMRAAAAQSGGGVPDDFLGAMGRYTVILTLAFSIVFAALITWYLLASKRVNATFRNRLPAGMAGMAAAAAGRSASATEKSDFDMQDEPPIGGAPPASGPAI